ncbi:response regulator [Marinobacterium iners]|jgi:UV DNA damage repair endonuclease|uniref:response regulator n=1 Tax=Marinobacterium iners TaxID=48076 RepID=UPI001F5DDFD5|nr:response regulator [Marinobacterium iners]
MEFYLSSDIGVQEVTERLRACSPGDQVSCSDEALFEVAKAVLVREKLAGLTIQLLDAGDYVLRTVTSRRRHQVEKLDRFNDRQESVLKALERVLAHCDKEGIRLIGFSDELVAVPAHLDNSACLSAEAVDVDTSGVYRGADSIGEYTKG